MTATSSAPQTPPQAQTNPTTRALLGYFPANEGGIFLQSISVDGSSIDRDKFDSGFAAARAHVAGLSVRPEANVIVMPDHTHLKALEGEPTYSEQGGPGSAQLASVEVGKCRYRTSSTAIET